MDGSLGQLDFLGLSPTFEKNAVQQYLDHYH